MGGGEAEHGPRTEAQKEAGICPRLHSRSRKSPYELCPPSMRGVFILVSDSDICFPDPSSPGHAVPEPTLHFFHTTSLLPDLAANKH